MKKIYSLVMLAAAMAVASCATEPVETVALPGAEVEVSLTTELPSLGSRSIADGNTVDEVHYGIYANGDLLEEISGTVAMSNGTATISTRLVSGKTYTFVFWAQNSNNGHYTVTLADNTASVAVDYTGVEANNEKLDAFFLCKDYTVSGPVNETFTLYRPFAQLNYATTDADIAAAKSAGVELSQSSLVVDAYTGLDLFTGAVSGKQEQVAFALANVPSLTEEKLLTNGAEYRYVATTYTLVNEKELSAISATLVCNDGTTQTISYPSAYLKRNYRTNVLGNLLTTPAKITIVVDEVFEDDKFGVQDNQTFVRVSNAEEFNEAFANALYDLIILDADIALDSSLTRAADSTLLVSEGKSLTIDLNEHTLSATSSQTGKSYNMFDVRGTLTVKNGTIEYQHTGDSMGWNNYIEIFYVGFNGALNLDGVNAKNLGGSPMAYVIDMVNAKNINVNVNNSTLDTTYIPVRVFNNSKTGVNNVTIKNSTLKGKYCFWVQYYLGDGRDEVALEQTLKLDIYNSVAGESNNNTFVFANDYDAPVLYGFNEAVYFDEYGQEMTFITPIEGVEGVGLDAEGNYVVTAAEGIASLSALVAADGDNGFAGKTVKLATDIDLSVITASTEGSTKIGDSDAPIGSTGERDGRGRLVCNTFKGTFDGQGHTIKGIYQSGWDFGYEWGQYGSIGLFSSLDNATVKNLTIEGMTAQVEGGDISFIAGSATGTCVFENITIKNSQIGTYNNGCGGIIGWSGAGNYTFKNIVLESDVVLGGLWGSFDSSIGGIVGQAEPGATYNFDNVKINCRIDAYNDVTAAYKYYCYRMCGMIIGRCEETVTIDGRNYPDLSKYNISFNDVEVNFGEWMNYHYCVVEGKTAWRVEPGFAYGGVPADHDHSTCAMHCNLYKPFDVLIGGDQYGVYGHRILNDPEVKVTYPESYDPNH